MPESIRPTRTIYMTGTVFDATTNAKLEAEFKLIDMETNQEIVNSFSDRLNGSFLVTLPVNKDYALVVNKDKYHPYSIGFFLTVPENSTDPYHQNVPLVPINSNGAVTLDNVFFDLDSYVLRKESYAVLDQFVLFLKDNPTMKIELQGHTDAQGDDKKNLALSDNRAKSVMAYLIQKGITADRLTAKGYGETKPNSFVNEAGETIVLTEAYINSLPANEQSAAHQLNRRTMYEIKR
jgi:outer membrane protein OmpA-like peptidoglycan-associated protein